MLNNSTHFRKYICVCVCARTLFGTSRTCTLHYTGTDIQIYTNTQSARYLYVMYVCEHVCVAVYTDAFGIFALLGPIPCGFILCVLGTFSSVLYACFLILHLFYLVYASLLSFLYRAIAAIQYFIHFAFIPIKHLHMHINIHIYRGKKDRAAVTKTNASSRSNSNSKQQQSYYTINGSIESIGYAVIPSLHHSKIRSNAYIYVWYMFCLHCLWFLLSFCSIMRTIHTYTFVRHTHTLDSPIMFKIFDLEYDSSEQRATYMNA